MKIEFSTIGDGTNVQVTLLDSPGSWEAVVDRFYTEQHQFQICARPSKPEYMSCEKFFAYLEEVVSKPVIGGKYGYLHPYWHEREEKRKAREQHENI